MSKTLTKRAIDAFECPVGKPIAYLWDNDPKGFGVRASAGGRKVYVVTYRTKTGKQRFMAISRTTVATLDKARSRAKAILYQVDQGEDPVAEAQERLTGVTMADLRDKHIEEWSAAHNKPKTTDGYRWLWEKYVMPSKLGKKLVREVTVADVMKLHTDLARTPYSANGVLRMLSKAFNLAETWGFRDKNTNPCDDVKKFPEKERVATLEPDDLGRLGRAIDAYPNPRIGLALRLYLATGCRKTEILKSEFSDVDYTRGILTLRDTKGGGKNEEYVALPADVLEEIRSLDQARKKAIEIGEQRGDWQTRSPYIIPGRKIGKPMVNIHKPWRAIRKAAGLPSLRIHDLRHVFASTAHDSGVSQKAIAEMLRHKQLSTTERYLHVTDKKRREAAVSTADRISRALNGEASAGS